MLAALPFPNIDPAIFTIPGFELFGFALGPFSLRWYALAYIVGLVLGWRYVARMAARPRLWPGGVSPFEPVKADDLLFWMTIGVVLGGRIGYVLFYNTHFLWTLSPATGLPVALEIWNGGMSFHGGALGVIICVILFARNNNIPLLQLGDAVACATPIGLFFGRIANFINGELWGRVTDQPWGMVFPQVAIEAQRYPELAATVGLPRHPSQLYEAALEGALLFAVLAWLAWRRGALKSPGFCTGVFLLGYGLARGFVEFFRQPDAFLGFDLQILGVGISRGQMLSLPMIVAGALFILYARRSGARAGREREAR